MRGPGPQTAGVTSVRVKSSRLKRMIEGETRWSRDFLGELEKAADDKDSHEAVDEMMRAISRRSRKGPPRL